MKKKSAFCVFIVLLISIGLILLGRINKNQQLISSKNPDYTFVFVGDSMTETLGNFDEIQANLKTYYPAKNFLLLNYGFGSTSILTLADRINNDSTHSGRIFQPINNIPYDAIFIESMGNNPLSNYPLEDGLKKQNEALDNIISLLMAKHPKSPIIFIATIAPNKEHYGEGTVVLDSEQRKQWVSERNAYIQNHMKYARDHQIPLIDVYDKSIDKNGDGDISYLDSSNFIHPSPTGIRFISQEIADFVYSQHFIKP